MLALYISLLDTEEQISKFEHIYTKYRGLMFYTAKGVLQDSYLAEDAVHETFLDIIRIIDSIRGSYKIKEQVEMKKKLWAVLVAFVALTVFATSAFAAVRWRNVASIYPGISAGDNSYTCEISCLSGTTKIDCTLVLYEKGLFGTYSEVSRSSSTYYGHTHEFSGTANIKSGTTYKLVTTATVTRNGSSETVSNTFEKKC